MATAVEGLAAIDTELKALGMRADGMPDTEARIVDFRAYKAEVDSLRERYDGFVSVMDAAYAIVQGMLVQYSIDPIAVEAWAEKRECFQLSEDPVPHLGQQERRFFHGRYEDFRQARGNMIAARRRLTAFLETNRPVDMLKHRVRASELAEERLRILTAHREAQIETFLAKDMSE